MYQGVVGSSTKQKKILIYYCKVNEGKAYKYLFKRKTANADTYTCAGAFFGYFKMKIYDGFRLQT